MSIQAQLADLVKQHQALEDELEDARQHLSVDDLKVVELKRRKLHLKDQIARLKTGEGSVH